MSVTFEYLCTNCDAFEAITHDKDFKEVECRYCGARMTLQVPDSIEHLAQLNARTSK